MRSQTETKEDGRLARLPACFVAGQAKSGTTLLISLLDAHPQLLGFPEETAYYPTVNRKFANSPVEDRLNYLFEESEARFVFDPAIDAGFGRDYSGFPGAELKERFSRRAHEDTGGHLLLQLMESYGEIIDCDFDRLRAWFEKTPANRNHIDAILHDFPHAKILLTLRDPRAVLAARLMLDRARKPNHTFSIYEFLRNWRKAADNVLRYRDDRERFFVVRFEALLSDPEPMMRTVASFLGIDFEECLLRPSKAGRHWGGNSADRENDFREISTEPIDRWKSVLNPVEIGWIEHHCGEMMNQLGYKPVGAEFRRRDWFGRLDGESWGTYLRSRRKLIVNGID